MPNIDNANRDNVYRNTTSSDPLKTDASTTKKTEFKQGELKTDSPEGKRTRTVSVLGSHRQAGVYTEGQVEASSAKLAGASKDLGKSTAKTPQETASTAKLTLLTNIPEPPSSATGRVREASQTLTPKPQSASQAELKAAAAEYKAHPSALNKVNWLQATVNVLTEKYPNAPKNPALVDAKNQLAMAQAEEKLEFAQQAYKTLSSQAPRDHGDSLATAQSKIALHLAEVALYTKKNDTPKLNTAKKDLETATAQVKHLETQSQAGRIGVLGARLDLLQADANRYRDMISQLGITDKGLIAEITSPTTEGLSQIVDEMRAVNAKMRSVDEQLAAVKDEKQHKVLEQEYRVLHDKLTRLTNEFEVLEQNFHSAITQAQKAVESSQIPKEDPPHIAAFKEQCAACAQQFREVNKWLFEAADYILETKAGDVDPNFVETVRAYINPTKTQDSSFKDLRNAYTAILDKYHKSSNEDKRAVWEDVQSTLHFLENNHRKSVSETKHALQTYGLRMRTKQ